MGLCWCKDKVEEREIYVPQPYQPPTAGIPAVNHQCYSRLSRLLDPAVVDKLVLDTLGLIAVLVDNEQEPPTSMMVLHNLADNEEGFLQVVQSMINVVPLLDPLGPSIITLLLDDCPLPSKESVFKVVEMLNLSKERAIKGRENPSRERNTCVVLGCIAETLAGPRNLNILNENIIDYLFINLEPKTDPNVILFSLIALEKIAQSSQYKKTILDRLEKIKANPIGSLEKWRNEETDFVKRQVGFCAQWVLDNLFVTSTRKYSYLTINMDNINAMLNTSDVSEYLKISPDGLEARCDAYSFESVRCTTKILASVWYYEVLIITPGVMQIGWATKDSNFLNHEGYGIGDDEYSLAYDGCRKLIWYNAKCEPQQLPAWRSGDILGCLIDLDRQEITFSVNGVSLPPCSHLFRKAQSGFFAAASFMSFQQCRFNFGAEPFKYPPPYFINFNEFGSLKPEEKIVMPRHVFLSQLRQQNVREDSCLLCFDHEACVRLTPCNHSGFCLSCVRQLTECPMCRARIELVLEDNP